MEPRKAASPETGKSDRKVAIMQALDRFVAQRPGLEFGNYGDADDALSVTRP